MRPLKHNDLIGNEKHSHIYHKQMKFNVTKVNYPRAKHKCGFKTFEYLFLIFNVLHSINISSKSLY